MTDPRANSALTARIIGASTLSAATGAENTPATICRDSRRSEQ